MNETRKVTVTVELAPLDVLLLQAISTHTGQTKAEVVANALRLLFVAIPRPDDAQPPVDATTPETPKANGGRP